VPRADLPQALVLNGLAFTGAQAFGPAVGGLLVAAAGPQAVFLLNAASFLGQIIVIWRWHRTPSDTTLPAEHVTSAIRAGIRYLRFAPALQIVIARTGAYVFAMSAVFALLPVIARRELHLGPGGYGILFGCLGVGSVVGAFLLPRIRSRANLDVVAAGGTIILAALLAALGAARSLPLLYLLMGFGGFAQMGVMSTLNLAAQSALPNWVRGRGLSVYTLVFQFAIATGAITWGLLASRIGLRGALFAAAAFTIGSVLLIGPLPLARAGGADMTPVHWPEPHITITPDPDDGPVLVTCEYTIDPANADAFAIAMRALRRARRRDGAVRWGVWYDLNQPSRQVESYIVASWGEHLRQRERSTEADREAWQRVRAFHVGEQGVNVRWHLARRPPAAHELAAAGVVVPVANPGQA
jgi:MFS family permease